MTTPTLRPVAHTTRGLAVTLIAFAPLAATLLQAAPTPTGTRSVYMNGVDISSARSQSLKNVDLSINETGDIFIVAPHYQVTEEDTYVPLSKFVQGVNAPAHKPPQAIGAKALEVTSPKAVEAAPAPAGVTAMLPKAGEVPPIEPPPPSLPDDAAPGDPSK